jgi:AraC family transcriptional regulator of adaptative response/methylated-DNA-[protein]-cysteine methyltransferase
MNTNHARTATATLEDARWQHVLARDASADGEFFYSVSSSGVYCRPSCPSRRAKPEHVAFHSTTEEARRAGFRPCKRCKPDRLAVSASDAGAEVIRHALVQSSLGLVLVAVSARGTCAILLGDDADALKRDLRERFPAAVLKEDAGGLAAIASQVSVLIESSAAATDLSLDLRGTPFQRRVWQALRDINRGATASYAQIAARIGAPKAARAVAQACAANPLAVAIPCHRVVRGDGALSGYRWGVARKRALLRREGGAG